MSAFNLFKYLLLDSLTFYCMGGGGSSTPASGGNDNLWNAQATKVNQDMAMSAQMFDSYQKYAPGYLETAKTLDDEVQSGVLTSRARTTAGADSDQAMSQGLAAGNRSLERYGATMNPNAMAHTTNTNALQGAANKAGAMGKATQWGENMKRASNSDALAGASGQQGTAVQMSANANQGLASMGSMQTGQNYMDSQNAAGAGKFGASAASALFKADGGYIDNRRTLRLAEGGVVSPVVGWRERMAAMPTLSRSSGNYGSTLGNVVSGAAPTIVGELAKPYLKGALGSAKAGLGKYAGEARNGLERMAGVDQTQAPASVVDKSTTFADPTTPEMAAQSAETSAVADAATTSAAEAASATAATDAAAATAEQAAAAASAEATSVAAAEGAAMASEGALVAANSWNPVGWLGAGLMAANALGRADGGSIDRQDLRPGGNVEGPGTETSDSIPAQLSDGEFVLNAEAVKIVGKERLEEINAKGLRSRGQVGKVGLGRAMAMYGNNSMKGLRKHG